MLMMAHIQIDKGFDIRAIKDRMTAEEATIAVSRIAMASETVAEECDRRVWICLHVRAGREKIVENLLIKAGVKALSPRYEPEEVVRRGRKIIKPGGPMLPGYVMVHCGYLWQAFAGLEAIEHVHGVVGGVMKPLVVSERSLNDFIDLAAKSAKAKETPLNGWMVGETARIKAGPFVSFECNIVTLTKKKAEVEVSIFGRANKMTLPLATLEKL
ncbi:transcription antitermination factor NusG [Rhizobium sp. SG_E_25_P2]|uniref:transcription termination/antitermination protein NusG n=1 Tax=Rhizobium sp. SG_E_25_P2 TaxID=2879942 RepID=UPI002473C659|nr:transcription termination/antitermination NusG family protein [Rhizobium sp. SG_E_25_P2]MDH6265524.1 transcription antitermination factor NusG [Rhizobium sp. SG_E_25_P2]